ncbi:MAG: hypothetical protein RBR12_08165 [Sulfurospirillum cavolei]|uniref:hypothetical protein n=1 Tax=Sulfurospirillum cavolei TaxID=366522 RepID=UPI0005A74CDD|nr:hypothetical protein [Sulfurospirillum cavolei]MDY0265140.1 hypothetical protein [Sulfurospirillum cavolei]
MKEMIERICGKRIVFSSLETIPPTALKTRKKVTVFSGVDLKSYYHVVFRVEQKSRFLVRHAYEIFALEQTLEAAKDHRYFYKHIILHAPLCSKAQALLNAEGWKIYHDIV